MPSPEVVACHVIAASASISGREARRPSSSRPLEPPLLRRLGIGWKLIWAVEGRLLIDVPSAKVYFVGEGFVVTRHDPVCWPLRYSCRRRACTLASSSASHRRRCSLAFNVAFPGPLRRTWEVVERGVFGSVLLPLFVVVRKRSFSAS